MILKILSKASGLVSFSFFILAVVQGYRIIHLFDVKKQEEEPDKDLKGNLYKLISESALFFIIAISFLSFNEIMNEFERFSYWSMLNALLSFLQAGCMIYGLLNIYGYLNAPGESILTELKTKKETKEKLSFLLNFVKEKFLFTAICFLVSFVLCFITF